MIRLVFRKERVDSPNAQILLEELSQVLIGIIGNTGTKHVHLEDFALDRAFFVVGCEEDTPMCCAGIRPFDETTAEVKRVYARENHIGAGTQLMAVVETLSLIEGYDRLILECRTANPHAIEFYKKIGYTVCENYPPYEGVSDAVCMEKTIRPSFPV